MTTETIDDGGPAFPVVAENGLGHIAEGMSLRDWFAGQALVGACASPHTVNHGGDLAEMVRVLAFVSYSTADAMLAERAKAVRS